MVRLAGWCLLGLTQLGALASLIAAVTDTGMMLVAVPFLLAAFGMFLLGALFLFAAPIVWLSAYFTQLRDGSLRIEDGLVVGEGSAETVLPLVMITGASLSAERDELELRTRDGDVILAQVRSKNQALAIVEAIAAGKVHGTWIASLHRREAAARWASFPWAGSLGAALLGFLAALPFTRPENALMAAVLAFGAVRIAAASARRPGIIGSLVLGKDGLALKQGPADRFIAFDAIARVDETEAGARLTLTSGEAIGVDIVPAQPLDQDPFGSLTAELAAWRRAELLTLLRRELRPEGPEITRAGALLERRGRTVRAWREALSELTREASGDYRTASLPKDQALAVLEDGHAASELRIGAALALTAGGSAGQHRAPRGLDPDTQLRLRVAVETCVNQDVRTALRDAIYGELHEDTLDRALTPGRTTR